MSYVCTSYILQAPEGFKLNAMFSDITGIIVAIILFVVFIQKVKKHKSNLETLK